MDYKAYSCDNFYPSIVLQSSWHHPLKEVFNFFMKPLNRKCQRYFYFVLAYSLFWKVQAYKMFRHISMAMTYPIAPPPYGLPLYHTGVWDFAAKASPLPISSCNFSLKFSAIEIIGVFTAFSLSSILSFLS